MSIKQWGPITWIFMHTFVEHINNNILIKDAISIIKNICNCLPCDVCKQHAIQYLKVNNINNIKTKENLKSYLQSFHNNVNYKTKKSNFTNMDIYKTYSLIKVTNIFTKIYINSKSKLMDFQGEYDRKRICSEIKNFITNNRTNFIMK